MCFQVAMSTMDNPLLKYNAKEYFFKASLCHFIVDELNAKVATTLQSAETFLWLSGLERLSHLCVSVGHREVWRDVSSLYRLKRAQTFEGNSIFFVLICFCQVKEALYCGIKVKRWIQHLSDNLVQQHNKQKVKVPLESTASANWIICSL